MPDRRPQPRRHLSRRRRLVLAAVSLVALVVAVAGIGRFADGDLVRRAVDAGVDQPGLVALALASFGAAFVVRAAIWVRVLPRLPFGQSLAALHVALGANHVLPLRLGEPLRVVSAARRSPVGLAEATASTVTLRAADLLAVALIAVVLAPVTVGSLLGGWGALAVGAVAAVGTAGLWWLLRLRARRADVRLPGPVVALGALVAWPLEAVLVWICAGFAGIDASFTDALLVAVVSVAAQTFALAPSGLGTYEAAAVAAWAGLGVDPVDALTAALVAHGLKTAYSLATGAVATFVPAPGLLGRLRLARTATRPAEPADPGAPVVLFLPAHDEEATVAQVLRRAPADVEGHPVQLVVIDDGSTDATASRAREAGADVVSLPHNRGLGAAVETGLREGARRGAAAVAFCDADGEYDPAELGVLTGPVLRGEASYVVGSRFAGTIGHMRPHRRFGNVVLTRALAFVSRAPVTDGQSGYRALSGRAAAEATMAHDYNYAQVLTLDLLRRGYGYQEVPITYSFRTEGRSFVRLGRYLRAVVPAVWRVVNTPTDAPVPATADPA